MGTPTIVFTMYHGFSVIFARHFVPGASLFAPGTSPDVPAQRSGRTACGPTQPHDPGIGGLCRPTGMPPMA